jgi:hypothetical protein
MSAYDPKRTLTAIALAPFRSAGLTGYDAGS